MLLPLRLTSPAKLNLTLDVVSRRKDGYHDLVSLFCPIGLYDDLCLTPTRRLEIVCAHPEVPGDERNLAYRAARLFLNRIDRRAGFHIELTKRIPVGAGLGGGSGNAAAVLSGLNRYYGEPLGRDVLSAMGRQLGADVPFFIWGRPAVAMGTGERLTAVTGLPPRWAVVIYPGFGISTQEAYQGLRCDVLEPNLALTKSENLHKSLLLMVKERSPEGYLHNDLEAVMLPRHPVLGEMKHALNESGALGALMTGSGSCVFGLFHDPVIADAARQKLSKNNAWSVFAAPLLTDG